MQFIIDIPGSNSHANAGKIIQIGSKKEDRASRRRICKNILAFLTDDFSIIASLIFQDVPFLIFRAYLLKNNYNNNNKMNDDKNSGMLLFFFFKNCLVVFLFINRFIVYVCDLNGDYNVDIFDFLFAMQAFANFCCKKCFGFRLIGTKSERMRRNSSLLGEKVENFEKTELQVKDISIEIRKVEQEDCVIFIKSASGKDQKIVQIPLEGDVGNLVFQKSDV